MTTPLTFERRIELLERDNRELRDLLLSDSRMPQGRGKRWNYWGVTFEKEGETYPGDGANTFRFRFVDLEYIKAEGTKTLTRHYRKAADTEETHSVGRTANGQWCLPDELVMISPLPPPPGTTDKGRWLITPQKNYYYGFLQGSLGRLSSTTAKVYKQDPAGTWTDTGFEQTVWDARFLGVSDTLAANTWVRFEWESVAWVVTNAACAPEVLE